MSLKHGTYLQEFKSFLRSYLDELALRKEDQYRIVQLPDAKNPYIHYQVIGKNLVGKALAEELMRNDFLIGFSKADIAVITHLGTQKELEKNTLKINFVTRIVKQFFTKSGKNKFLLKIHGQDQLVETVPEEIITNTAALQMLSAEDAAKIGFAAAENHYITIKKEIYPASRYEIIYQDLLKNQIIFLDKISGVKQTMELIDIFYNKEFLMLFNKLDQQLISFIAGEGYQKKSFEDCKKRAKFKLRAYLGEIAEYQDMNGNIAKEAFIDLSFDEELLNEFNIADRDIIRFTAGELSREAELALKNN